MAVLATCESCKKQYRLGDEWAGKTATCKNCGQTMQIPLPGPAEAGGPSTPAGANRVAAGSMPSGAAGARVARQCPICDSPLPASGGTCSVCGYSHSASKTLATTRPTTAAKAAGGGATTKSEPAAEKQAGSSSVPTRLIAFTGIGILALVVIVVLGLLASKVANERARIRAHERLDAMLVELREAREASHVQNIDDFRAVDLKAVVRDYAAKFAKELPHVPSYIQPLEGKDTALAEDKRRWIITLIRSLPADADLAPLQDVPSKSFAAEMIAKRLREGPTKF